MKSESTPSKTSIKPGETIELETQFGSLSRGKCWGKYYPNQSRPTGGFEWVEKDGGTLYLSGPGHYVVGSSDGFSREARGSFTLKAAEVKAAPVEPPQDQMANPIPGAAETIEDKLMAAGM
jgi:hypothetical protein